jgi:orotate phosphoribosyltransferase
MPMSSIEPWLKLLEEVGAVQNGHFLLSSGRHSERYIQCAKALEDPENATAVGGELARRIGAGADRVMSPPLGGILVGYEVARGLRRPFQFPERAADGLFQLRRGFSIHPGERIAVVEDVITTGRTTRELMALIKGHGAQPVCVAAIVDRSETHEVDGLPIHALIRLEIPTYAYDECPLCAAGIPISQPGSRKQGTKAGP